MNTLKTYTNKSLRSYSLKGAGITLVLSGLMLGQSALAQQLEEIIVTATRVEQSIQDVPISMSVMGETQLADRGIENLGDVLLFTPGAQGFGGSNKTPAAGDLTLRGIESSPPGSSSGTSVAMMADEMILTHQWMVPGTAYDMQRVEVLRGPQGTNFGRNATAGVVHMISNRPEQGANFTDLTVDLGKFRSRKITVVHNRDISDEMTLRIAALSSKRDGQFSDEVTGDPLDNQEIASFRAQLAVRPNDDLEIIFRAMYTAELQAYPYLAEGRYQFLPNQFPVLTEWSGAGWGQGPANGAPLIGRWYDNVDGDFRTMEITGGPEDNWWERRLYSGTVEARYNWNDLTFTSVSSYMNGRNDIDANGWSSGGGVMGFNILQFYTVDNFQTEFRVDNSAQDNPLQWVVGANYLDEKSTHFEEKNIWRHSSYHDWYHDFLNTGPITSTGVFGNVSYTAPTATTLSVGVRWSRDEKEFSVPYSVCGKEPNPRGDPDLIVWAPNTLCFAFVGGAEYLANTLNGTFVSGYGEGEWTDTTYRVSLTQSFAEMVGQDINLYASYSTGYTSGVFAAEPQVNLPDNVLPTDPEFVEAYELGFKGLIFDNSFRFDVAFYLNNWTDRQQTSLDPATGTHRTENLPEVEIKGMELQADWAATDQLSFLGQYAIVDTEDKESGDPLNGVMKNSGAIGAIYTIPLVGGSEVRAYVDAVYYDDRVLNALNSQPSEVIMNGNIGWTSADGATSIRVWGKNLTDELFIQSQGPLPVGLGFNNGGDRVINVGVGSPRSYGVTFRYRWND